MNFVVRNVSDVQVIEAIKLEGLSKDTAQISVNRLNKQLCETMHNSVSASVSECDQKKNKVNKWWNYNCTQARNRYRIFYHIWNSCGRPGSGLVYNCYRSARKLYRKTCRIAVNYKQIRHSELLRNLPRRKNQGVCGIQLGRLGV